MSQCNYNEYASWDNKEPLDMSFNNSGVSINVLLKQPEQCPGYGEGFQRVLE